MRARLCAIPSSLGSVPTKRPSTSYENKLEPCARRLLLSHASVPRKLELIRKSHFSYQSQARTIPELLPFGWSAPLSAEAQGKSEQCVHLPLSKYPAFPDGDFVVRKQAALGSST